ncbi:MULTISPECIES: YceH family protein [Shewanella]|uniref:YceH family protein n=1 Tax=Shewanella seohaensis TaxID=755175 RepID=A0ABV4VWB4_9GAMM
MELTLHEARVIGCLLEKEVTTPEQYPLSLNALTLACNQKTSRDPVLDLSEAQVQDALDSLNKKRLISEQSGFGSRVVKYKHRFCNTEFSELQLSSAALAIVCLLLLRGPQTPGELRTRSNRLHDFKDVLEVEACIKQLMERDKPVLAQLPREPGKRECRYTELFSQGAEQVSAASFTSATNADAHPLNEQDRQQLEARVTQLEEQVAELKDKLDSLIASLS